MKKLAVSLLILACSLYSSVQAGCSDHETSVKEIEAAAKLQGVIELQQSDFDSGTFRIKNGGYYILKESIEFDPIPSSEATRTDQPTFGWFAAITVETSANVVIDLNKKSISESQHFLDNRLAIFFANIELDNSPIAGNVFGAPGTFFPGDTSYVAAENVVIKNGTLARSAHWGVHGSRNVNVHLRDFKIEDFQVAGIQLSSVKNSSIKKGEISGLRQTITTRGINATFLTTSGILAQLALGGFPGAAEQFVNLLVFFNTNPQIFSEPTKFPEGSALYGIFVDIPSAQTVSNFPNSIATCEAGAIFSGLPSSECLEISDVDIHDLVGAPIEVPAIGSDQPPFTIITAFTGIIGTLEWQFAYDQGGSFNPNAFLQAEAFAMLSVLTLNPPLLALYPPNILTILNSILAGPSGHATFLANVIPIMGLDIQQGLNKGVFAIRPDCVNKLSIHRCTFQNISNIGKPGIEVASLPDGQLFANLPLSRYIGNDVWGVEFANARKVDVGHCSAKNISSLNGSVFGFDSINDNEKVSIRDCKASNMIGHGDSQTTVNPPSESYGFRIQNNKGSHTLTDLQAVNVKSPRVAFSFATEGTQGITFNKCQAINTFVTSPDPFGPFNKTAYGFYSAESDFNGQPSANTSFINCCQKNARVMGEESVASQTDSIAAGYVFTDSSQGGAVKYSVALNNHSGGGTANGARVDNGSQNTTLSHNSFVDNIADFTFASGYGVIDTAANSTTKLKQNCFEDNTTADILISR